MIFLNTCLWIELCCASLPTTPEQQSRAKKASEILSKAQQKKEEIITCKEQLLEIISAIQKIKMKAYNRLRRAHSLPGVGQLKEYRLTEDFSSAQLLCNEAIEDVSEMASEKDIGVYDIKKVLSNIHLVDINDYLYYQYCIKEGIDFYTFDQDFENLDLSPKIHIL